MDTMQTRWRALCLIEDIDELLARDCRCDECSHCLKRSAAAVAEGMLAGRFRGGPWKDAAGRTRYMLIDGERVPLQISSTGSILSVQ